MSADETLLMAQRKTFWDQQEPSVAGMIQAVTADQLADDDVEEIMAVLPDLKGKRVVDLAAGIGRFTTRLARVASRVRAVDVCESFIRENKARNQDLKNVTYMCDDVVNLDIPPGSVDVVFSNWLLKYLTEGEVSRLLVNVLSWLSPGGYFFFRESCFKSLGSVQREGNPTIFRSPQRYGELLCEAKGVGNSVFSLLRSKNLLAYINHRDASNQVCFLAQKQQEDEVCRLPNHPPAGRALVKKAVVRAGAWAGLAAGQKVLDVGCGSGDSAFFFAKLYGVHVHGLDLSASMIHAAIQRHVEAESWLQSKLHFEMNASLELICDTNSFDFLHVHQTLHKLPHKHLTLAHFYKLVKPGGKVVVSDYCRSESQPFPGHQKVWALDTVEDVGKMLREAGFKGVTSKDHTQEFIKTLQEDLCDPQASSPGGVVDNLAQEKLRWAKKGRLIWASFKATK